MNKLAKEYELKNTFFANMHGLQNAQNKSSCYDLAKLSYYCIKNEEFKKIVNTKKYKAFIKCVDENDDVSESQIIWENTNKLLERGFGGIKTGITKPAGACMSAWY